MTTLTSGWPLEGKAGAASARSSSGELAPTPPPHAPWFGRILLALKRSQLVLAAKTQHLLPGRIQHVPSARTRVRIWGLHTS